MSMSLREEMQRTPNLVAALDFALRRRTGALVRRPNAFRAARLSRLAMLECLA